MPHGVTASITELIALRQRVVNGCLNHKHTANQAGVIRSVLRGRGMEFSDVRNYQAGDEIRHMESRVTARTGRPHIKLYEEEHERPVVILVDFNPSMYFGTRLAFKSLVAARLASLIAWTASIQGNRVGGLLFSTNTHHEFTPKSRNAGVLPLLAALANYTNLPPDLHLASKPRMLSDALLRLRRVAKPGHLLVLISDFYTLDEHCEQHLTHFKHHNDLLTYHLCDILELKPPKPGRYPVTNGQQTLCINTIDAHSRHAYQEACEARIHTVCNQLKRIQTRPIQVTAQTDLPLLVHQTFPGRSHG